MYSLDPERGADRETIARGLLNAAVALPLLAVSIACSGESTQPSDPKNPAVEFIYVREAAAACALDPNAVVTWTRRSPPNNIGVVPLYDNTTPQLDAAKHCLRRWAAAHNYVFVEQVTGGEQ
jgi:hypothetical protein